MPIFDSYHQVIRERMTNPSAQYYADPWWEEEISQFTMNIHEAIAFIDLECSDEELWWLGEVFEDIAAETQSADFLSHLRIRAQAIENPEWRNSVLQDILFAEGMIRKP